MIAATTAVAPIDHRQPIDSVAPTTVEMTIPTPIATWKHSTSRPRSAEGASSATYIGAVCVAPPTANPRTSRASASTTALGASAAPSAPTTKTTAIMNSVRRRPIRSESAEQPSAPTTAPSRMLAVTSDFAVSPRPNSGAIWSRAPEMMPVS